MSRLTAWPVLNCLALAKPTAVPPRLLGVLAIRILRPRLAAAVMASVGW